MVFLVLICNQIHFLSIILPYRCIKYAKIQLFTDQHFPISGQNLRFCLYKGKYKSVKTSILVYFMQWFFQVILASLQRVMVLEELK